MQELIAWSNKRIKTVSLRFKRYLYYKIDWNDRFIGIVGSRGVGKTTLLLQYLKENFKDLSEVIYISLDNFYFTGHKLLDVIEQFTAYGGKVAVLDEVHKYPNWSIELKNIYDLYPELKIIFSASSVLEIYKGQADLSRRVSLYNLWTLSFREFLSLNNYTFATYSLNDILENHINIASEILEKIKPLKEFAKFLDYGNYPFFVEGIKKYHDKLNESIIQIFESDIPQVINITSSQIKKLKLLMYVISTSAPFTPNITKLSQRTEIDRKIIYKYLDLLERANLILTLRQPTKGIAAFNKPEKIFLHNPNLIKLFAENVPNQGNIRETFFYNQLAVAHSVHFVSKTDFFINRKYLFEVGGKNKTFKQIAGEKDAFLAVDNIEIGFGRKIPIWLFGFLY